MINKIIHLADIHMRNFKRHKEYRLVFKTLFKEMASIVDDNTIIYLAGDLVHSKTEMTPELISLVSYFLKNCADLAPTIMILGNHDVNLKNETRLDALTPIVETLNHPNLHYWKESGQYEFDNITFSVFSVLGSPDKWILHNNLSNPKQISIALHHGAVFGSTTDLGHSINNEFVKIDLFNGFDLALLGDIHAYQFLNDSKTIHYPGSVIQQDHGESLYKGFTIWNLNSMSNEFIQVKNEIGYVTLTCKDNKILNDPEYIKTWPKKIRLRIKHESCTKQYIQSLVSSIKSKFTVEELSTPKVNSSQSLLYKESILDDIRDIEFQNRLITEYIETRNLYHLDVDYIRHINRIINSELNSSMKLIRNVHWKPKRLEFSNMFSYGSNNVVNFENLKGIQGIFAKNASGKSSLLDVLTYCIYDKCSRAFKGKDILNNRKTKFSCKFSLELNGEEYVIERLGFKNKNNNSVRVEVYFYKVGGDNIKQLLNGMDRDQTNKVIRDLLGTYDDFLLTTLSAQIDNKNFILKSQKERKELLYSFLDLSVFDQLNEIAKKYIKNKSIDLNSISNQLLDSRYDQIDTKIDSLKQNVDLYKNEINTISNQIKEIQNEVDALNKKILPIPLIAEEYEDVNAENISDLEQIIDCYNSEINSLNLKLESLEYIDGEHINQIRLIYQDQCNKFTNIDKEEFRLKEKIKIVNDTIESVQLIIDKFEKYEYNPDCKFCVENVFVKDALVAKTSLPVHNKTKLSLETELELLVTERDLLRTDMNANYQKIALKDEYNNIKTEIITKTNKKLNKESELYKLQERKKIHDQYHSSLIINSKLTEDINKLKLQLDKLVEKNQDLYSNLSESDADLKIAQIQKVDKEILQKKSTELYKEVDAYNAYIEMTHNDGLPYMILSKILPIIENEVNLILAETVDFYAKFESDDKFNINCYLTYSNDASWPVEMASGMERFIISLAIRCALVEITSLPRPVFMAIDEGFGSLDIERINSLESLFNYMRTKFEFIIAVSHVDSMKDMVDGLLDIIKDDHGFSKININ